MYYYFQYILELKYFLFAQFCSMLIELDIDLRELRSENLKFRTDLQDQAINNCQQHRTWQKMIIFSSRLLKKSSKCLLLLSNFAFHCNCFRCKLWLWCIQKHATLTPEIVSKFLSTCIWSDCAVTARLGAKRGYDKLTDTRKVPNLL